MIAMYVCCLLRTSKSGEQYRKNSVRETIIVREGITVSAFTKNFFWS